MGFNCDNCLSKCKAACCGPLPIEVSLVEKNKHKIVRPVLKEEFFTGPLPEKGCMENPMSAREVELVTMSAAENYCPFLTEDYKCNIYYVRPFICRGFGSESHPFMTCSFQDKDG